MWADIELAEPAVKGATSLPSAGLSLLQVLDVVPGMHDTGVRVIAEMVKLFGVFGSPHLAHRTRYTRIRSREVFLRRPVVRAEPSLELGEGEVAREARRFHLAIAVGDDEPLTLAFETEIIGGEPRLEVGPGCGLPVLGEMRAKAKQDRLLSGPFCGPVLAPRLGRAFGERPAGKLVQATGHLMEAQGALFLAEDPLGRDPILPPVPRFAGLGVDAVHDEVDMRVRSIAVGDDKGLVLGEPQLVEEPIGDPFHLLPGHDVVGMEGDRDVIHGMVDAGVRLGRCLHDPRGNAGVVDDQVPDGRPLDPVRALAASPMFQVADQGAEPAAAAGDGDHWGFGPSLSLATWWMAARSSVRAASTRASIGYWSRAWASWAS